MQMMFIYANSRDRSHTLLKTKNCHLSLYFTQKKFETDEQRR